MKKRPELLATFVYLAVGTLWIVFSDSLVQGIAGASSSVTAVELQLAKGLVYVALTGVLVFFLVRSATRATQRHTAELEQRIADRTEELADLHNGAPCGYHALDSEGRFVRVNDCELEWLGYTREQLLGTRFADHLETDSRRLFEQRFPEFKDSDEVYNLELRLRHRDGTTLPRLLSASVVHDEAGRFVRSRSSLFDMTELLEARGRIASLNRELTDRNRELETRNRDLASFSYSISHDLRAPVRAVAGFSEIISTRFGESLPNEARHYLDNIVTAGKRMNRLIDDLLRYARLGGAKLELEDLSLTPIVDEIAAEFEPALMPLSGALQQAIGDVRVRAERSLLEQILSNLVQNAIRYRASDRSPEIRIQASRIDGRVELSVTDNGIGIAPEHHERIFSLFQRLQNDDHDGAGIGLALARKAAELLGGSLTVRASSGEGSTFVLTLQEALR